MIGRPFVRFVARRSVARRSLCKTPDQPKTPTRHPGQFTNEDVEAIHRMLENHRSEKVTVADGILYLASSVIGTALGIFVIAPLVLKRY